MTSLSLSLSSSLFLFRTRTHSTPMIRFWARGSSVAWLGLAYAVGEMPAAAAAKLCTVVSAACALLYPFNAKFNLTGETGNTVKYPMHYVPEVLMTVLTVSGIVVSVN